MKTITKKGKIYCGKKISARRGEVNCWGRGASKTPLGKKKLGSTKGRVGNGVGGRPGVGVSHIAGW